jgi:hypothetical protein
VNGKTDMRFGAKNIRSLYRSESVKTEERELSTCNLNLLAVKEVKLYNSGTEAVHDYTNILHLYGNGNDNNNLETG